MAKYIDKDTLVAEIERRKDVEVNYDESSNSFASYADETHYFALDSIENFINALEVKEVDLKKELELWMKSNADYTGHFNILEFAKYFFELGLKAQKGE